MDEPVLWYEGAGTSDRRWLLQDRIGSVIGAADAAGAALAAYAYDEYGRPNAWTGARLRYTGQMLLPEAQLYHYRARAYSPTLGRFLQTDPILYAGGMNLYAYVGDDPLNWRDPSGLDDCQGTGCGENVVVCGNCGIFGNLAAVRWTWGRLPNTESAGGGGDDCVGAGCNEEVIVEAQRCPSQSGQARLHPAQFFRIVPRVLLEEPPLVVTPKPSIPYPADPNVSPGPGWVQAGPRGNWWNPATGESVHPDLNHPPGIDPHYDYHLRGPHGGSWRWYPDGRLEPKAGPPLIPLPNGHYVEASC